MDPAEIRLIREMSLKGYLQWFFENSVHPPSCEGPLKILRHLIR
jgi:hypothetical protein